MKTGIRGSRKVPVIMQMEALECGAACLAMILAYYGKWVPLEQVRSDCGVSRDGASAKNVLRAARSYHMTAKGFRYEPETLRKKGSFPCIIHWNFNHFVVLCGFSKKGALLNDPARGRVTVSWEEFDRSFTGICRMFSPEEGFEKGGSRRSILGFVKERLRGTGPAFLFVVLTGLIAAAAGILNPVFSRVFLDRILTGENPEWLPPLLGLMAVVAFCQISVSIIQAVHMSKIEGKLAIEANASFMWHVLRLPMEFFSQRLAGDLAVRQSSNEGIASSLIRQLAPSLLNFVMLAFYLLVMLRYSPILTAVGLFSVLINVTAARLISKRRVNITRVQMRDAGKLSGAATAGIEMIESIKASGAENGFFQRWAGYQASVNASNVRLTEENRFLAAVPGLIQTLAGAAVLLLGALLIMRGEFSIGALLAFQGFLQSFFTPFQSLVAVGQSLQEMRTKVERIEDVMNYAPDPETEERGGKQEEARKDGEADAVYAKLSGRLVMEHVTFGYSRLAPPIIEDFSLTLEPGRSVAFVGASGCGKSTLSKLISGLYRPWSGRILFDGKPREEISREILTGSIAVVDQDIILFEDTISNNIRLWDDSIEDFEVIMAARDAHIHETIMERDGGYDYRILEGGRDFSGGQRQRLEIARVLAQDPTILIMDEATSALDARLLWGSSVSSPFPGSRRSFPFPWRRRSWHASFPFRLPFSNSSAPASFPAACRGSASSAPPFPERFLASGPRPCSACSIWDRYFPSPPSWQRPPFSSLS